MEGADGGFGISTVSFSLKNRDHNNIIQYVNSRVLPYINYKYIIHVLYITAVLCTSTSPSTVLVFHIIMYVCMYVNMYVMYSVVFLGDIFLGIKYQKSTSWLQLSSVLWTIIYYVATYMINMTV